MNSLQRYYLNNFLDADRQEGMDLMTSHSQFSLDGVTEQDRQNTNPRQYFRDSDMSLADAARQLIQAGYMTEVSDAGGDQEHVLIRQARRGGMVASRQEESSVVRQQPVAGGFSFRWLPGDLQAHMKSKQQAALVSPYHSDKLRGSTSKKQPPTFDASAALEAMDRRAASDTPWWIVPPSALSDDSSNEDDEVGGLPLVGGMDGADSNMNAGHLLGGAIAACQAPIVTASLLVGAIGFFSPRQRNLDEPSRD